MSVDLIAGPTPKIQRVIRQLKRELNKDYAPPHVKRHAHPKMHGCVQATFRVDWQLAPELRHGVFEEPGREYPAWVRFSNGLGVTHDLRFNSRGMAIKLLHVEADRHGSLFPPIDVSRDSWETGTQDFVMATHDVFVLPDAERYDYVDFVRAARVGFSRLAPLFLRLRLFRGLVALVRGSTVLPVNPLALSYFSQTPYRLGPALIVKLHARPRLTDVQRRLLPNRVLFAVKRALVNLLVDGTSMPGVGRVLRLFGGEGTERQAERFCERYLAPRDYLRQAMAAFLSRCDAEFEILVQVRTHPAAMPTDDATIRWSERLSPYRRVGVLTIPRQVFWPAAGLPKPVLDAAIAAMERGENMSFSPWHGLTDHEPIGNINIVRGQIYAALSAFRRDEKNHVQPPEPAADFEELRSVLQSGVVSGRDAAAPMNAAPRVVTHHAADAYAPDAVRHGIALCLSGGGFRAALFHLGAVRRLYELGVLDRVRTIAATSGGTMLAAFLAQRCGAWRNRGLSPPEWDRAIAAPFRRFAATNLNTIPILVGWLPWNWTTNAGLNRMADACEARGLTSQTTADLPDDPQFLFGATDLVGGGEFLFERGSVPRRRIALAVAVSSCYPGFFRPFSERHPRRIALVDGGVHDDRSVDPVWRTHEHLLVSDGGDVLRPQWGGTILWSLFRSALVLWNQSQVVQKRWLISSFIGGRLNGTYWSIESSPVHYTDGDLRPVVGYTPALARDLIATMRTDYDAFSDAEAAVLENHGYLMTDAAARRHLEIPLDRTPLAIPHPAWMDETAVREALRNSAKKKFLGRW